MYPEMSLHQVLDLKTFPEGIFYHSKSLDTGVNVVYIDIQLC